ncbi:MAG TPA: hypothetical protein VFS20_14445 [Longimicrobium sp.]|nr:hypothetical protein [Longimicrobium sp.]
MPTQRNSGQSPEAETLRAVIRAQMDGVEKILALLAREMEAAGFAGLERASLTAGEREVDERLHDLATRIRAVVADSADLRSNLDGLLA